ncbi:hypothetical protein [Desulfovibrio sp. JC022]|uniref:hypothetical protein n=1 Tax=Desulfovibrio sp. JC022 TaxID=2593642 RepID=UPI0013D4D8A1|nr:hypothetical protein [Desulfovibrio sp. JC022]NDV24815.1 hypothetical protein [Desulfovibrio sp. JC022]
MIRQCFIGTVCSILLIFSSIANATVTLQNKDSLILKPQKATTDSIPEILYIPTSYYNKLKTKDVVITKPYQIQLQGLFTSKHERDQYSFRGPKGIDITREIFEANNNYKEYEHIVTKDQYPDHIEFQVAPSKRQKDNFTLDIKIPLVSKYVTIDQNKDMLFKFRIYNNVSERKGDHIAFLIKPCAPFFDDITIDNHETIKLKLDFKSNIKYTIESPTKRYTYKPSNLESFEFDLSPQLRKAKGTNENAECIVMMTPVFDNTFSPQHIKDDICSISVGHSRDTNNESNNKKFNESKKNIHKSKRDTAPKTSANETKKTPAKPHSPLETQRPPDPKETPKTYTQNLIKGIYAYQDTKNLYIKVGRGQTFDYIADKIHNVYGISKKQIMSLIITNNINNKTFANQVPEKKSRSRKWIKVGKKRYDPTKLQVNLKFYIPLEQLLE